MTSLSEQVGLPIRPFLYTVDQLSTLLELSEQAVKESYLWYEGRQQNARPPSKMKAHNIAPNGEKPEWRVTEQELIRFLRFKGIKIYVRSFARS